MPLGIGANIICLGDSITEARGETEVDRWPTRLQFLLDEWKPQAYRVYNRGVSGNTTAQALDRFDADVLPLMPALLILELGGNDANVRSNRTTPRVGLDEFVRNLGEMNRLVESAGGRSALIAIHLPAADDRSMEQGRKYDQGNGASYAQNFYPYREAIHQFCRWNGLASLDIEMGLRKAGLTAPDIVCHDGIHLTTVGNFFYASSIFQWIRDILDSE